MPLANDGGRDIALQRNSATGAFDTFLWDATGNPAFDDSDSHTVLSCLVEEEYWANPLRKSRLLKIKLDVTGTDTDLVSAAQDSLASTVKLGRIGAITKVTSFRRAPGNWLLTVNYKARSGHVQNLRLAIGS